MSSVQTAPFNNNNNNYASDSEDGQATGGRRAGQVVPQVPNVNVPRSASLNAPAGQLLKGATDENGNLKGAALMLGIKLDLEAEIHLTARVRGDITIGLY